MERELQTRKQETIRRTQIQKTYAELNGKRSHKDSRKEKNGNSSTCLDKSDDMEAIHE